MNQITFENGAHFIEEAQRAFAEGRKIGHILPQCSIMNALL
jgi:hypothetical protein